MAKKKINTLMIDGRIGKDAELRQAGNYRIAKFSICHNNSKKVDGQWQDDPMWIDCEYFMHDSDDITKFCKGAIVEINGSLKEDKWEKDGQKRSKFKVSVSDIVFVDRENIVDKTDSRNDAVPYPPTNKPSNKFVDDVPGQWPDSIPF